MYLNIITVHIQTAFFHAKAYADKEAPHHDLLSHTSHLQKS
jgi:hypothetical protein